MIALTIALAVLIGVALGLLGGGGSILAVPLLVYVAGLDPKEAIATSLLVVGTTSAVALLPHARAGRVRWRTGLLFGVAGMAGAYAGGRLAAFLPGELLLGAFALMMVATAVAMIRGRRTPTGDGQRRHPVPRIVLDGLVVGLVTGLVGAGGGFLIVPALVLLAGLPMPVAVGTSLLVIAMKSAAGLAGYLTSVQIDWPLALAVTAAAVVGSLVGSRLTGLVPPDTLRKAFGWFVVAMGLLILLQQVPEPLAARAWFWPVVALVGLAAVGALGWSFRSGRRSGDAAEPVQASAASSVPPVEQAASDKGLLGLDREQHDDGASRADGHLRGA
jgi:uncharacterized membrane protein YfcA